MRRDSTLSGDSKAEVEDKRIEGWLNIGVALWGGFDAKKHKMGRTANGEGLIQAESLAKRAKRFMEAIVLPAREKDGGVVQRPLFGKKGKTVYTTERIVLFLLKNYLFGIQQIAEYMNVSVAQFRRHLKRSPWLKKRLRPLGRRPGTFVYARKSDIDEWVLHHIIYTNDKTRSSK